MGRALRQFTVSKGKTAGRNSSGRITAFHRGGGAKRLQRRVDLKRSTSAMGIVERVEYDPNRSSRIALVRWIEGVLPHSKGKCNMSKEFAPPIEILEPTTATICGSFSFSSLPGKVDQGNAVYSSPVSISGLPTKLSSSQEASAGRKITCAKDVFLSAFSAVKAKDKMAPYSFSGFFGFPRIAVAGAKPAFIAPAMKEEVREKNTFSVSEVRNWKSRTDLLAHRLKRKAAISWQSFRGQDTLGLGIFTRNEPKPQVVDGSLPATSVSEGLKVGGAFMASCVPVSYVLASHQLEPGKMVINCNWSRPSSNSLKPAHNAQTYHRFQDLARTTKERQDGGGNQPAASPRPLAQRYDMLDLNYQVGNCMPLANIRIGTLVHDIECNPGQGGKLVRSAGTCAKLVKEPAEQCLLRLPSGAEKLIDSQCRATIGMVSNPSHGARKLRKAGQSRWLGRRPIVRGVAMNPIDHPHGGGEGRTKGGRPSVSPWGKPTKDGFKTARAIRRKK